jgi:hypothetical protein
MSKFWGFLWWRLFPHRLRVFHDAVKFSLNFLVFTEWTSTRSTRQSVKGSPATPIPWITYPAYEFLSSLNFSKSTVLEFGGGASSIWWAKKCKSLQVVEHNYEWFKKLRSDLEFFSNTNITYADSKSHYISQLEVKVFDIVIIDGEYREEILIELRDLILSLKCKPKLIILDNSERMPNIIRDFTRETHYTSIEFNGMGPINTYSWSTSVLTKASII